MTVSLNSWVSLGRPKIDPKKGLIAPPAIQGSGAKVEQQVSRVGAPEAVRFTVFGSPRTKKTNNQVVVRNGKPVVLPSPLWRKWIAKAVVVPTIAKLPDQKYSCRAIFYRDRDAGDAVNYYQGLADAFEHWKILSNDRQVVDWDGSRILVDAQCPRVEVTLTPVVR